MHVDPPAVDAALPSSTPRVLEEPTEPARTIRVEALDPRALYHLMNSVVVPRPIAWVASRSSDGVDNLAPHSFFTIASTDPATVAFTTIGDKDTVANIRATGDFVVNVVTHDLVSQMNLTSADAPEHVSEFDVAALTRVASERVSSMRVAEVPVSIECTLDRIVEVGNSNLILGTVVAMHIAERLFDERDRIAPQQLDAVARMGGATYATTRDRFDLARPTWAQLTSAGD